jgi:hypothetical protein
MFGNDYPLCHQNEFVMKWVILTFSDLENLLAYASNFSFDICELFPQENTFSGIVTEAQLRAACTKFAATLHCYVSDPFASLHGA